MILLNFMKRFGAKMSAAFPHGDQRGNRGGSSFSPFPHAQIAKRLLAGFCLFVFLFSALANAQQNLREQIDGAIHQHLHRAMNQHAKAQGWKSLRLDLENTPLSSIAQLAPCPGKIDVSGNSSTKMGRQQLTLSCSEPIKGWPIKVSTDMSVFLQVAVSSGVINRGDTIAAHQIKLEEADITRNNRGFYHNPQQLIGMSAKRRIRANQILTPDLIDPPQLVKRGDKVKIIANKDGISASMSGEALEKGGEGEVIRVKNLSSGKTIEAKVIEPGLMTSTF